MAIIKDVTQYFPDPTKGRPLFYGQVYVGLPDLDPEIEANQKQLNIIQEDGSVVPVDQPFILSAGGTPVYQGSNVQLDTAGSYSIKVLDKNGDQIYYVADSGATDAIYQTYETTEDLIAGTTNSLFGSEIIETLGYSTAGDGGGAQWQFTGVTGQTPSQSPAQLGDALLNDANGNQWGMILNNTSEFDTFAELELSNIGNVYQRLICRERANAEYIVQPAAVLQLPGDALLASGLVAELQVTDGMTVDSFGADPSGATASDQAAQEMLGRTDVFIMGEGSYLYNDSSTFNISGVNGLVIKGAGRWVTRALFNFATVDMIKLSSCKNFKISDMTLDVPSVTTRTSGNSIHLLDSEFGSVDNILFSRFRDGLRISSTTGNESNTIYHSKLDFRAGEADGSSIILDGCVDVFFQQCTSNNADGEENGNGILILECLAAWFTDMDFLKSGIGLNILALNSDTLTTWLFFKGCAFDKCTGDGIRIFTSDPSARILGVFFDQCWSSSNGLYGVNINSSGNANQIDGVTFNGHNGVNNQRSGVRLGNSKNVHIGAKSVFSGNSQESTGVYNGINVDVGVSDWSVVDCTLGGGFRYGATQNYGIAASSGPSDNYQIALNRTANNVNTGVFDGGTGTNKYIAGNI